MGLFGWLGRRFIAAWIFAPLLGFWYGIFAYVVKLPPGSLGIAARPDQELVIAAIVAALISDWLIVRQIKKAMKRREAEAPRR